MQVEWKPDVINFLYQLGENVTEDTLSLDHLSSFQKWVMGGQISNAIKENQWKEPIVHEILSLGSFASTWKLNLKWNFDRMV